MTITFSAGYSANGYNQYEFKNQPVCWLDKIFQRQRLGDCLSETFTRQMSFLMPNGKYRKYIFKQNLKAK